jgi:hypothetical protein
MANTYGLTYHEGTKAKWSGRNDIPNIGDMVTINMNGLGSGVVQGYFIEGSGEGFLGVYVKLDNPPKWWTAQQAKYKTLFGRKDGCAMVFGAELKS